MSSPIVADRFIANGAAWIDLATGRTVRLRVVTLNERRAEYLWADACGTHALLRHPMLNPLIDYGALDRQRVFEAYAALPPVGTTRASAQRLLAHATHFLQGHGVSLTAELAAFACRTIAAGPSKRSRACGIVLQERRALGTVGEVLDATWPGGPALITVTGAPSSGLRTLRLQIARAARLRGYVPVSPRVLAERAWMIEELARRHVCVLADDEGDVPRGTLPRLLDALGHASPRRHVVIAFVREDLAGPTVVPIQPMGVRAMASMVFVDAGGPSAADLFEAARGADGKPGVFLDRLGADAFEPHVSRALVAHEATHPYDVEREGSASARPRTAGSPRNGGVLSRAANRADALAQRGRHAAAVRLLSRAIRVLAARGEVDEAARCAGRLGHLHLSRGQIAAAVSMFERARATGRDAGVLRSASLGLAFAWMEDGRLTEAEALLRSIAVAAALDQRPDAEAAYALARCLYWQGRYAEAAAILQAHVGDSPDARCLAMAARIQLADGTAGEALQRARRAAELAAKETVSDEVRAETQRTLAAALGAAGDFVGARQHVREALNTAQRARRPLDSLRARLLHLDLAAMADGDARSVRRLAERLLALGGRVDLPRLLRFQLGKSTASALKTPDDSATSALEQQGVRSPRAGAQPDRRTANLTELQALLELCHTAADDREALDRLCASALDCLCAAAVVVVSGYERRLTGHAGKPWDGHCPAVTRAFAAGASAPNVDIDDTPWEAAAPVRFGGEIIGVVGCRWIAGTAICPDRTAATLKAVALVSAAPLRATLDRAVTNTPDPSWPDLLGESPEAVALREAVTRAARAPYPVLIEGESGSGKELVARAVHRLSPRRDRRFCAVNCAALTDELLEAELFGHTRGAFTGAVTDRSGLFEEADGGTLFLDEVGELSPRGQAKLLRVIQEGEIRRVGESFARKVDVRIVAATNRRLEQEAAEGRFRTDLRFRVDVIRITVPALRERIADIPLLATHFWNEAARRVGSRATLSPDALAALSRYDWPGNVRELQNVIAWAAVHSPKRGRVGASALPAGVAGVVPTTHVTFEIAREEFERRFIRSALARASGHRARAAASLGITRQGLAKMMRRLRIDDRPSP